MDISQVTKDSSAQQATTYQKLAQQTVAPVSAPESKTFTAQAVQATEKTSDSVQIKYSATSRNLDTVRAIEQMHARLNDLVKGVRQTNEGLNSSAETVDQLQTNLQKIVKNFPPFTADSPERQKILMSYVSIRKEMVRLMVPPPPPAVYEKVKGMWDAVFDGNGQISGTQIPELTPSSSDSQVKDASASLVKTSERLATLSDSITKALVLS
jgi:seryl-tRNA synthetase